MGNHFNLALDTPLSLWPQEATRNFCYGFGHLSSGTSEATNCSFNNQFYTMKVGCRELQREQIYSTRPFYKVSALTQHAQALRALRDLESMFQFFKEESPH